MNWKTLVAALAALGLAGAAQADMIAGWNFSQYVGDGSLDTDGDFLGENTLSANFSNRIAGDGAGAAANPYGTMYLNGSNGSSNIDPDGFPLLFGATQALGSLVSNEAAPTLSGTPAGAIGFNGPCGGQDGQNFCEVTNAMVAQPAGGPLSIVFEATLSPDAMLGQDWIATFGGRTLASNGATSVTVDFSTDGTTFGNAVVANLTGVDTPFTADFSAVANDVSASAFIRFTFDATTGNLPVIDNVAINATVVPEPGTISLLALGLVGLGVVGRRRA